MFVTCINILLIIILDNVGKSSFTLRYVDNRFLDAYEPSALTQTAFQIKFMSP